MKTLVIAIAKNNKVLPACFELISAARSLGDDITTVIGAENAAGLAEELASRGGGKVLAVSNPALAHFNEEIMGKLAAEIINEVKPQVVLGPANAYGKSLFGRLAALCGGTMTSDVTGIALESDSVTLTRPSYGGSVIARVSSVKQERTYFVTVRPKIFPESKDGSGEVVSKEVSADCFTTGTVVKSSESGTTGVQNLAEADVIVSAGRGIKGPENVPLIKELADSLNAAFGASRAIVDAGWVEYSHQVGQTGRTVNPKLYVAVGISGAIQHLVGMRSSQNIVAINKDKDAPIFNLANYGIVGDLFEIVPALTKKFQAELK